ncbi:somatostatin-1-like [Cheilinus undulatus]|uniref:somatostatin-1-like n=1 Tax=Cheilinus undulatus TaxID=241271 RepID=UPI001BD3AA2A|nr:somatostatin-1-like [Cheilinus undulatus]
MARALCILALLCLAACAVVTAEPEQGLKDLQLQQLSWLEKLQDKQESKKQNLFNFLYKLSTFLQDGTDAEKQEKRRGLSEGMSAQTRRPGCKFFFWKSLTAC